MGDDAEKSAQDKIGDSVGMIRIDEVLKPCEILTVVGSILAVGIHQYIHIKKNHAVVP